MQTVSQYWFPSHINISSLEHNPAGKCLHLRVWPTVKRHYLGAHGTSYLAPIRARMLSGPSHFNTPVTKIDRWLTLPGLTLTVYCKLVLVKWLNDIIFAVLEELLCVPAYTHIWRQSACLISDSSADRKGNGWTWVIDSQLLWKGWGLNPHMPLALYSDVPLLLPCPDCVTAAFGAVVNCSGVWLWFLMSLAILWRNMYSLT